MSDDKTKSLRPNPVASGPNQKVLIVAGSVVVLLLIAIFGGMFQSPSKPAEAAEPVADESTAGDAPKPARPAIFDEPTARDTAADEMAEPDGGFVAAPGTVVPPPVGGEAGREYSSVGQGDPAQPGAQQGGTEGAGPAEGQPANDPRLERRQRYEQARRAELVSQDVGEGAAAAATPEEDSEPEEREPTPEEDEAAALALIRSAQAGAPAASRSSAEVRSGQPAMGTAYRPKFVAPPASSQPYRPRILRPGEAGAPESALAARDSTTP